MVQPAAASVFRRFSSGQHRLLAHGGRQVEVFLPVRMVVIDGGGRHPGEEHEAPPADDDAAERRA